MCKTVCDKALTRVIERKAEVREREVYLGEVHHQEHYIRYKEQHTAEGKYKIKPVLYAYKIHYGFAGHDADYKCVGNTDDFHHDRAEVKNRREHHE